MRASTDNPVFELVNDDQPLPPAALSAIARLLIQDAIRGAETSAPTEPAKASA